MFNEMVFYHSILVYTLLLVVIMGFAIPILNKNCNLTIKRLRIYIFIFHGIIATVAFSGLVAFTFAKMAFNINIFLMVLTYLIISIIESIKYLKFKKSCRKNINIKYSLINILILIAVISWVHAHAVSIS